MERQAQDEAWAVMLDEGDGRGPQRRARRKRTRASRAHEPGAGARVLHTGQWQCRDLNPDAQVQVQHPVLHVHRPRQEDNAGGGP